MSLRSLKKKARTAHQSTKGGNARRPAPNDSQPQIEELLVQANTSFLAQHYDLCQQSLLAILDRQQNHLPALQLLGRVQVQTGRYLEALQTFELGQVLEDQDIQCSFGRIYVLIAIGRITKAFIALDQLPIKDARACEVYFKLGRRLYDNKRLEESLTAFQHALRIAPALAITHYNIGMIYETWAMHQPAASAYEQALCCDPSMIEAHVRLAKMYIKLYRTEEALAHVEEAIKCEGMKSDTCNIAAQAHMQQFNHDRAIELFQHAVALQIDNQAAHFNLIYLCNRGGSTCLNKIF